jgi:hypothetical protein
VTARYEVQWRHPAECDVCVDGQVPVSRLLSRGGRRIATALTLVVPCPHCRDAASLLALIGADRVVVPGGAA